jgi:hypothetical protein
MYEALFGVGIKGEVRWQELEGNGAIEVGVLGLVDYTHPSTAKFLKNFVV